MYQLSENLEPVRMSADIARTADPTRISSAPEAAVGIARTRAPAQPVDPVAAQAAVKAAAQADAAELEAARRAANRALAEKGRELTFEFDDELGRVIAKLVDTQTREVIRQVPSAAVLAVARALAEGAHTGSIVHAQA